MKFICATCGKVHDAEEVSFGASAPMQWELITEKERERSALGAEQCQIESSEGMSYYIRACLDIPIQGTERQFTWGVWCSLSEKSYAEMSEHWNEPERQRLGPYFGWLCTKIPEYPETMHLKTMVHQRRVGQRPFVELEATDHPLAVDQRTGISETRLRQIVEKLLHR